MTDKQPEALEMATELEEDGRWRHAALLRTQHKQIAAYKLLTESQEAQLSQHRAQADKFREAIATLQSDREANATLTAEIERLTAAIKWEQNRAERIGTHGPGCEKWGGAHYECLLRSVEGKDALLRQALETWDTVCNAFGWDVDHMVAFAAIRKELSQ